jgi:XTP/dITP diphosphohydrolase
MIDIKAECPKCGVNLLYYNQQERLALDADKAEAEFGDLLFSLINASRLYKINPDNALERTNNKFIKRFNYIEQAAKDQGKALKDMTLTEMDELWNEAKALK